MRAFIDAEAIRWMPVSLNDLIWFVAYDSLYDHLIQAGVSLRTRTVAVL